MKKSIVAGSLFAALGMMSLSAAEKVDPSTIAQTGAIQNAGVIPETASLAEASTAAAAS